MSVKNYGPLVSGYLDPDGRNWESTIFQAGKPVLDKELNLQEDIATDTNRLVKVRTVPTGWASSDFLDTSDMSSPIYTLSATANELEIPNGLRAVVNGWNILVGNTNFNGANRLDLGAGPVGAAAKREDLVILEVWRRLIPPAPTADGKSPAGRIWWFGNVKIAGADDLILNFTDDILDGAVGSETTKRVQIQYRLRVIQGVDLFANPYGIDHPSVVAHSVPPTALTPDGAATLFGYVNQSPAGDPGLWRAGDGNPANTLGTVDGYMYGIPLMSVVRRNTTAFARNTNHNGGVASPGPSDRPDGFFNDIVEARDIIDLRLGTAQTGWDYSEVIERNFNYLLDNVIRTEIGTTLVGGGVNGHTVLTADEIGITNANGGDGVITGDTPGGNFIGQFDAVLRRFSDRPQVEVAVLKYNPADGSGGGPNWANNDVITIDPSALPVFQDGAPAFNWAAYAPATITFSDILFAQFVGTGGGTVEPPTNPVVANLGQIPQGSVSYDIGTVPPGITNEPLYIYLTISYPTGLGLTRTPTDDFGSDSLFIHNPAQMPVGAPVYFEAVDGFGLDFPHREATITYRTVSRTFTVDGAPPSTIFLPARVDSVSSILINTFPYVGSITIHPTGFIVLIDPVLVGGETIDITVQFKRPFPQNDEQVTVYYESRMPQTGREFLIGTSLTVIPRYIGKEIHTLTVGSGSFDEAYPFPFQYVQPGGVYPTSGGTFNGDHELAGRALITVSDFNATTGKLQLPTLVGYVPNPEETIFDRLPGDVDAEGRSYFKSVSTGYVPNAHAQQLSDPKRHKVLLPMLAELAVDSPLGFKGQFVLVVLSRWALFDADNSVIFDSNLSNNLTSASVYRLKGNLLNRRFD